jgi:hypothetical protein
LTVYGQGKRFSQARIPQKTMLTVDSIEEQTERRPMKFYQVSVPRQSLTYFAESRQVMESLGQKVRKRLRKFSNQ